MSNTALFGNGVLRSNNKNLVEIKAGKMTMKGKMVYADNRKGQLYIYQSDDSLMHFCWKDRTTGIVEDDLIIFPDDCEFTHVSQCKTGRVYLLKFKSSSRKFFFWLQDLKTDLDEERCKKINEILNNPPSLLSQRTNSNNPEGDLQNLLNNMSQQQLMQLFGGVGHISGLGSLLGNMNRPFNSGRVSTTSTSVPNASRQPTTTNLNSKNEVTSTHKMSENTEDNKAIVKSTVDLQPGSKDSTQIHLSDLQNFLSDFPVHATSEALVQKNLINELSSAIQSAVAVDDNLENSLSSYLPPGDYLSTIVTSPQFFQALSIFWTAFTSGHIAPIMKQFGLGTDVINAASNGDLESFFVCLEEDVKKNITASKGTKVSSNEAKQTASSLESDKSIEENDGEDDSVN